MILLGNKYQENLNLYLKHQYRIYKSELTFLKSSHRVLVSHLILNISTTTRDTKYILVSIHHANTPGLSRWVITIHYEFLDF